jgi:hypothetical protein
MAFLHGRNSRILVDGNELSAFLSDIKTTLSAQLHDVTVFQAVAKSFLPGLKDGKVTFAGFFDPTPVPGVPAAPTLAAGGAGNPNGAYKAQVTFVAGTQETAGGVEATITVTNQQINWTNIPIGPAGTTARKLYRTAAAGASGSEKLATTISDNTTTTFTDNVADGSLGATVPNASTFIPGSDGVFQAGIQLVAGNIITWSPGQGLAIGNKVQLLLSKESDYEAGAPVADVVKVAITIQADQGIDPGVSLHDLVAETTTANFASVDNAAASTNGGVAHLNATILGGISSPSFTMKVQHSTDNSSWADLVTFAAVTASGAQRIAVAAGTTVNRYVRGIISAVAGSTPTCTFNIAFARR